jgi:hypothetical protein
VTQLPAYAFALISLALAIPNGLFIVWMGAPPWAGYAFGVLLFHLLMLGAQVATKETP